MTGKQRGGRPAIGEPVLDRALRLLGAFSADEPELKLTELSQRAEIPVSTTSRLAQKLVGLGALERRPDGAFRIGIRLFEIASLAPRGHGLRAIVLPYLEDLHRATRQHVQLAVREKDQAVIVERLSTPGAGRVLYQVGARMPLHLTGFGTVLLAFTRPAFQESYLRRPLVLEPEGTPIDVNALRERLSKIRRDGLSVMTRASPQPVVSVAAPIFDRTMSVVAALSVLGADDSIDVRAAEPAVRAIARAVSRDVAEQLRPQD
jgi:DNA-binding IclR family transcriptional regulator